MCSPPLKGSKTPSAPLCWRPPESCLGLRPKGTLAQDLNGLLKSIVHKLYVALPVLQGYQGIDARSSGATRYIHHHSDGADADDPYSFARASDDVKSIAAMHAVRASMAYVSTADLHCAHHEERSPRTNSRNAQYKAIVTDCTCCFISTSMEKIVSGKLQANVFSNDMSHGDHSTVSLVFGCLTQSLAKPTLITKYHGECLIAIGNDVGQQYSYAHNVVNQLLCNLARGFHTTGSKGLRYTSIGPSLPKIILDVVHVSSNLAWRNIARMNDAFTNFLDVATRYTVARLASKVGTASKYWTTLDHVRRADLNTLCLPHATQQSEFDHSKVPSTVKGSWDLPSLQTGRTSSNASRYILSGTLHDSILNLNDNYINSDGQSTGSPPDQILDARYNGMDYRGPPPFGSPPDPIPDPEYDGVGYHGPPPFGSPPDPIPDPEYDGVDYTVLHLLGHIRSNPRT